MHNKKTIEYINSNYKKIIKTFENKFQSKQTAEDCLQHILFKLCKKEYGISHPKPFIKKAMAMAFSNYKRTNKRYYFNSDSTVDETEDDKAMELRGLPIFNPTVVDDIETEEVNKVLYNEINKLPPQQRDAVIRRMNDEHENSNTEKANYRHGFFKLRNRLIDINAGGFFNSYI